MRAEVLNEQPYFGGAGVNPSRLRPGSGLGLGFGAFLTSFLPLSLLPMPVSVTQKGCIGEELPAGSPAMPIILGWSTPPRRMQTVASHVYQSVSRRIGLAESKARCIFLFFCFNPSSLDRN
jgi:hypothetical protein